MAGESRTDRLVADSEKLRRDLLRMAEQVTAFVEQLTSEAQVLRAEAGEDDQGRAGRPPRPAD